VQRRKLDAKSNSSNKEDTSSKANPLNAKEGTYPTVGEAEFPPIPGAKPPPPPDLPKKNACPYADWSYQGDDPESRIVIADFGKMDKSQLCRGQLPPDTEQYFLELVQRTDLSVICKKIWGEMTAKKFYDALESHYPVGSDDNDFDNFKIFRRELLADNTPVWRVGESVFVKYEDFAKFSKDIAEKGAGEIEYEVAVTAGKRETRVKKILRSGEEAIYLMNLDAYKSYFVKEEIENELKLNGFLPGKRWCATRYVSSRGEYCLY